MWVYSRIDTIKKPNILETVRKAGIKWLCLGIESGDKKIRLQVAKGKFEEVDVKEVIEKVKPDLIYLMPGLSPIDYAFLLTARFFKIPTFK